MLRFTSNKAKEKKVKVSEKGGRYIFDGDKNSVNDVFNFAFDKSINRGNYAPATMMHEETGEIYERFSPKEIKMAIGVASDPRYAKGNMTGAVTAIERMKKGLSKHPQVAAVLKRQNENLDEAKYEVNFSKGGKLYSVSINAKNEDDAEEKVIKKHKIDSDDIRTVAKEGFASDAQRRAAFASGYKEKGKKKKESTILARVGQKIQERKNG